MRWDRFGVVLSNRAASFFPQLQARWALLRLLTDYVPRHAISIGCAIDGWRPQTGVVHSVFAHAINLLMDDELWTVLDRPGRETPFAIALATPGLMMSTTIGDAVAVRAGSVSVGRATIDCRTAVRWTPAPIRHIGPSIATRLVFVEQRARSRAWSGSPRMAEDLRHALHQHLSGSELDIGGVVQRMLGCGPGLTPAGDDVLVGALTVLASGIAGPGGAHALAALTSALWEMSHATSDISRHLLEQASRGLPGRPLHDLARLSIEGGSFSAMDAAVDAVLEIGATSGADACLGLVAACRFACASERAAA